MKIAGIVAEYNPFHLGHQYQIQETRRKLGEDSGIVCVMSGDFVQRGEPAVFSKFARAESAVRFGADLIVELPLPWCMSSAEQFAAGAVRILNGLGVVDVLSFGSECGDAARLEEIAACLCGEEYRLELRRFLNERLPYAVCRQKAVEKILGPEHAAVLSSPNDNLAVEYLKAIRRYELPITPLAVRRTGAGHDAFTAGDIRSGAELREILTHGEDISPFLPREAYDTFQREVQQGRGPVTPSTLEPLLLSRLRMLPETAFAAVPDAGEGLEHKLSAACGTLSSLEDIYAHVKSKRYTHARIRRMTLSAALGIKKEQLYESPPYARILAFNDIGASILRTAKGTCGIPILSKAARIKALESPAQAIFELTAKAHDLYVLAYQNQIFRLGGQDWQESPRCIC